MPATQLRIDALLIGVHAAVFTALILALRRRGAWRGGAVEDEGSCPYMDGDILAADLMFFAEQTSLSWVPPHTPHTQIPDIEHVQTCRTGEGMTVAAFSSCVPFVHDDHASTRITAFV